MVYQWKTQHFSHGCFYRLSVCFTRKFAPVLTIMTPSTSLFVATYVITASETKDMQQTEPEGFDVRSTDSIMAERVILLTLWGCEASAACRHDAWWCTVCRCTSGIRVPLYVVHVCMHDWYVRTLMTSIYNIRRALHNTQHSSPTGLGSCALIQSLGPSFIYCFYQAFD